MSHNNEKIWFVTGASSGLGRAMVTYVLEQGNKVVATLRKPTDISDLALKYPDTQLLVIKLDVVSPVEITAAFNQAVTKFGRIDVVYNNAGFSAIGEVEATPDDVARRLFEVNFWGATNVSREAVRIFRDINSPRGGHLIQASSMVGVRSLPVLGYYSASKHAFEGITQALSNELDPSWNIKVTLIELGGFKTRVLEPQNFVTIEQHPAYSSPDSVASGLRNAIAKEQADGSSSGDANKAVREMYKIAYDGSVGLRVPLGTDSLDLIQVEAEQLSKDVEASRKWSTDLRLEA